MKRFMFLGILLVGCNRNPQAFLGSSLANSQVDMEIVRESANRVDSLMKENAELQAKLSNAQSNLDRHKEEIEKELMKKFLNDVRETNQSNVEENGKLKNKQEEYDLAKQKAEQEKLNLEQLKNNFQVEIEVIKQRQQKALIEAQNKDIIAANNKKEQERLLGQIKEAHALAEKYKEEAAQAHQTEAEKANSFVVAVVAERKKFLGNLIEGTSQLEKVVLSFEKKTVIDIRKGKEDLFMAKSRIEAAIHNLKRFGQGIWQNDVEFLEIEKKANAIIERSRRWW